MMKPPTEPPKTPIRRSMVWWVELIQTVVMLAVVVTVYVAVGGDGSDLLRPPFEQIENPSRPTIIALMVMAALGLTNVLTDRYARRTERAYLRWYEQQRRVQMIAQIGKRSGATSVPAQLAAAGAVSSRQVIEEIVRQYGPITWTDLHTRLVEGGPWGPQVAITQVAMSKLLTEPGPGTAPASWLAPRGPGEPYDHVDNVALRTSSQV